MAFYPFDPNGNLVSNLIVNEPHSLTSANGVNHQYMVPRDAPFFDSSMVVIDADSGDILTKGVDYDIGWTFDVGLSEVGVGLSGAVYLIDQNRNGNFKLRYHTLGGDFVNAITRSINDGLRTLNDLTVVTWDDINAGTIPTDWPPTPHTQPVTDVEAVTELIDAINNVANAMMSAPPYIHMADIIDLDTSFIAPLLQSLNDIALAITNKADSGLRYEIFEVPRIPEVVIATPAANTWLDIGLIGTVVVEGTYQVTHSVTPEFPTGMNPNYKIRVVLSDDSGVTYNDIPMSYLNGVPIGLGAGWIIKVQIRLLETVSSVKIASALSGNQIGASLTLVRLGI